MPCLWLRENEKYYEALFNNTQIPKVNQGLELGRMNSKGQKILTVFLLECLSSLEVLRTHAYDGVDQIPPKIGCKTKQNRFTLTIPCTIGHLKPRKIDHLKIRF